MGRRGTAQYKETLKTYAFGVSQDVSTALADFIAPRVPVGVGSGMYKKFDDKNAFQIYNTRRAIGGPATRIEFEATDGTFNCEPNALEVPIDDAERDKAGDAQQNLEEAKTRTLVISSATAREDQVMNLIKAQVSATANKGVYSDLTVDPIAELDELIEAIATECGMLPNAMIIGLGAWRVLKNHPLVRGRIDGGTTGNKTVNLDKFAGMLLNPQMDIRMGILSKDTTKFGKGKAAVNIVGAEIFMFMRNDNPTQYDPGFAKTFSIGATSVEDVYTYRADNCRSDILAVDWSEDIKVVSTSCCRRVTLS
ncbi:MAG: hypothetical protein PHI93_10935 [Kiritimatiellae bacterium]|nr:hypothetical protein [Kiritimatiellia bacterium]